MYNIERFDPAIAETIQHTVNVHASRASINSGHDQTLRACSRLTPSPSPSPAPSPQMMLSPVPSHHLTRIDTASMPEGFSSPPELSSDPLTMSHSMDWHVASPPSFSLTSFQGEQDPEVLAGLAFPKRAPLHNPLCMNMRGGQQLMEPKYPGQMTATTYPVPSHPPSHPRMTGGGPPSFFPPSGGSSPSMVFPPHKYPSPIDTPIFTSPDYPHHLAPQDWQMSTPNHAPNIHSTMLPESFVPQHFGQFIMHHSHSAPDMMNFEMTNSMALAQAQANRTDLQADLLNRINDLWTQFKRLSIKPSDLERAEFSKCVLALIDMGLLQVRNLTTQRAFSMTNPNPRVFVGIDFLTPYVRSRFEEAILADITFYLCDKKASRFIIAYLKKDLRMAKRVIQSMRDSCVPIVKDKTGSLAVQKILCFLDIDCIRIISEALVEICDSLLDDPYGNYVITKLIRLGNPDDKTDGSLHRNIGSSQNGDREQLLSLIHNVARRIVDKIMPQLSKFCNGKYSSPVLEAIIRNGGFETRRRIENFLLKNGTSSALVEEYMGLEFANYVVQTSCDECTNEAHRDLFVEGIGRAVRNDKFTTDRSSNREAYVAKMLRKYNIS